MAIKLTLDIAAKTRGIATQKALIEHVELTTGTKLRTATVSDMYRNSKTTINRKYLDTIMQALEITDFNEVLTRIND